MPYPPFRALIRDGPFAEEADGFGDGDTWTDRAAEQVKCPQ